ncbi:MAG: hypothetical protein WEC59_05630 [Salibacteraceae bacterium]
MRTDCFDQIEKLIKQNWQEFASDAAEIVQRRVRPHIDRLTTCQTVLVEYPYVDKVYRNSYYRYYSSKNNEYHRDCIRISLFRDELQPDKFRGQEAESIVPSNYLGFIILRPTNPSVVGRSAISPSALGVNLDLCLAPIAASAEGLKVSVNSFPHSSQDTETIKCAETTIWSLLEYYSARYQEYQPVLPSDIIQALSASTAERQLPSAGLNITQIAFALKSFGFAPRVYADGEDSFGFPLSTSIYLESGIPLVAGLLNSNRTIGHAILIIGREQVDVNKIDSLKPRLTNDLSIDSELQSVSFEYFDYHQLNRKYVVNDDNFPAYQSIEFDRPCIDYPTSEWKSCQISHIATPLYHKMYLEANAARMYFESFLFLGLRIQEKTKSIMTRIFMASTRSYKHYLAVESGMQDPIRNVLMAIEMPKFIWICELGSKDLFKNRKVEGFVIIDATETIVEKQAPILAVSYNGAFSFKPEKRDIQTFDISLRPFSMYTQNLKSN